MQSLKKIHAWAQMQDPLFIHRIYSWKFSLTTTLETQNENLDMVIPIQMHLCNFVSNWSVASRTSSKEM